MQSISQPSTRILTLLRDRGSNFDVASALTSWIKLLAIAVFSSRDRWVNGNNVKSKRLSSFISMKKASVVRFWLLKQEFTQQNCEKAKHQGQRVMYHFNGRDCYKQIGPLFVNSVCRLWHGDGLLVLAKNLIYQFLIGNSFSVGFTADREYWQQGTRPIA